MNFKQLYYFVETCKYMNYSVTADHIFVTPQGISKAIKTLEKDLGQQLFYVQKNNLFLTDFGSFFLEKAQHLLHEYEQMRQEISKEIKKYQGFLRIGIPSSAKNLLSSDFICDFLVSFPEVKMEIVQSSPSVLEQGILSHSLDVAIGVLPSDHLSEFDSTLIVKSGISIIANKGDPLLSKKEITLKDLKNRMLSLPSDMTKIEEAILQYSEKENLEIQMKVKSPFIDLNRSYLHRTDSVGINATFGLDTFPFTDKVDHRPIHSKENLEWGLHIFTLKNKLHHPWVKLFTQSFLENIHKKGIPIY